MPEYHHALLLKGSAILADLALMRQTIGEVKTAGDIRLGSSSGIRIVQDELQAAGY